MHRPLSQIVVYYLKRQALCSLKKDPYRRQTTLINKPDTFARTFLTQVSHNLDIL